MSEPKYFVIKEVGANDSRRFAVVSHGEAFEGKYKRKCLWVHDWYRTEDEARASAHSFEFPEFN